LKTAWKRQGVATVLAVLGLVMVVVGVLFSTVFRPDTTVNASSEAPTTAYFVTHEGVLNLVNEEVTVTASAPNDQEVTVVLGRGADVQAWLHGVSYTEISGLSSWDTLKTNVVEGEDDASVDGNLADSDMWLEVKTGKGEVDWTLQNPDSNLVLLAATDGSAAAPSITLTWERSNPIAWIIVLIVIGAILVILGITLFVYHSRRSDDEDKPEEIEKRRQAEFERQRRTDAPVRRTIETTVGGKTHVLPSRAAIREARERGESTVTVDGQNFETGLIPIVKKVREVEEEDLGSPSKTENTDNSKK